MNVNVWECTLGHESAHSENEVRSMVIEPRCGLIVDGVVCMAHLRRKVRPMATRDGAA